MDLSLEELETIREKSYQKGYEIGIRIGFEEGYTQGTDYSDSCLIARIEELEEELEDALRILKKTWGDFQHE